MDIKRIEKIIKQTESNYIWLERELKNNILISTAIIAVFFLILYAVNPQLNHGMKMLICALLTAVASNYVRYKKEYNNYVHIAQYLEAFEEGQYHFRTADDFMKQGIHSQITEQLERVGGAFSLLKQRLMEEKEGTKKLVTDISHQLKTPIAALGLTYDLMGDATVTKEEQKEFFQRGRQELEKLRYLVDTLTNLSRMEADMIQIQTEEIGISKVLLSAVNGVYMKAVKKQIEIEMSHFEDEKVRIDSKWTSEAIANVLDNAVKYSPPGSSIHIEVEARISHIIIEIGDQGIGISKKDYNEIFHRFFRGKSQIVTSSEGSGVGLYLTRYILEKQGGSICAFAKDKGSVFRIMIPKR